MSEEQRQRNEGRAASCNKRDLLYVLTLVGRHVKVADTLAYLRHKMPLQQIDDAIPSRFVLYKDNTGY